MSPTGSTWIQVFDDAVKIGFGALIAGFFAWLVARYNAKGTIQKLVFERRSKILADAAQSVEASYQAFLKWAGNREGISVLVAEAKSTDPAGQQRQSQLIQEKITEVVNFRGQLMNQLQQGLTAQSLLMLLGDEKCGQKADALMAAIMKAVASCEIDGASITGSQAKTTVVEAVQDARTTFFVEMAKAFKKM